MTTYILIGVVVLIVLWAVVSFNGLVLHRNRAKEAWADIDVQLKRRYDLIPNLVNTVKGAANFETSTLEKVIQARNSAMAGGNSASEKSANENALSGALKSVFALAESYPDLKASANFLQLQSELSDTENKVQAARRFYNSNVMSLNTAIESFPGNIIAGSFSFTKMDLFELNETDKKIMDTPVQVNL